jgi:hypothetical protein
VSLRISTIVQRCSRNEAGKVRVRLGDKCVIVEDLVLHRWRQRGKSAGNGECFDGCRLRPNTWRVLRLAADAGLPLMKPMAKDMLAEALAPVYVANPTLRATQVDKLLSVVAHLQSRGVLEDVVRRERSEANPGLPDLFLWRSDGSRAVQGGQFIEVKRQTTNPKWREPLSPGQKSELEFLRSLGLVARVVWLTEMPPGAGQCNHDVNVDADDPKSRVVDSRE